MDGTRQDPKDRKVDALIAAAIVRLQDLEPDFSDLAKLESNLTEEDRLALQEVGPDFITQIVSGALEEGGCVASAQVREEEPELAGAMNRGEGEELTDRAKDEIERKIRTAQDAEDNASSAANE